MATHVLRPRKMDFPFNDSEIPRHWLANSPLATHLANGINLLFPLGERFFIRSVHAFFDQIEDPELLAQAKGFMAQEVRHGIEHERFFESLEAQGLNVQRFLQWYNHLAYEVLEPKFSPLFRLAVTTALEHYTALFGEAALTEGLTLMHPNVQELMLWHAAEEIEHKAVAFDILKGVNPSYSLRIAGMLMATVGLLGFWMVATVDLLRQEQRIAAEEAERSTHRGRSTRQRFGRWRKRWRHARAVFQRNAMFSIMARGFVEYLHPDFHPNNNDNYHLAHNYLATIGRLDA